MWRRNILLLSLFLAVTSAQAQFEDEGPQKAEPLKGLGYRVEMQGGLSGGKTPLWLNANRHGLSSLETTNGYIRAAVERPLRMDSLRNWGVGYGLDVATALNYSSTLIVQQAYAEGRWHHATLTVGAKEYPMELKNNELSSGSQTLGINARPVPQVRLALADYWTLPILKGWMQLKGHVAFGRMTDQNWQRDFTGNQSKWAEGVYYHSKAGYLRIGNEESFCPWSVELGLEMAANFGGTSHNIIVGGEKTDIKNASGLSDFYHAFVPGGSEGIHEGTVYTNVEGNQLGSWLARVNYDNEDWRLSFYADKFFEDHSAMLLVDYNGYGEGEAWNQHAKRKYFFYDLKDWLLGAEYHYKYSRLLQTIVLEYVYSKYQSGPVYHDHNPGRSEHISGNDNFYNHFIYSGWQHWGQVMGNPLYRSPIYNTDGTIQIDNNRFTAVHLGLSGHPTEQLGYRLLATWQEGLGTYVNPYTQLHHNVSLMAEAQYHIVSNKPWLNGVRLKAAYGMDFGKILGGINYGCQLTITKQGLFGK